MDDQKQLLAEPPPPYSTGPPPPHSTGPPPPQSTTTTTVVTQPVIAVQQQVRLGECPVQVTCPTGGHQITTNVHYENGTLTWVVAALLCFFLGPICALIPFCVDDLKDVVHTCPIDGTVIGVYRRMN